MCRYARDFYVAAERRARETSLSSLEPTTAESEPGGRMPTDHRRPGWAAGVLAALLGAGALAGVANGQPFGAIVANPPAVELAPMPVCNENMLEGISYEQAGVKRYLVLPESTPQIWYLLGISITTGLDAGVAISASDCSVMAVVNNPTQQRPYCRHLPNPGPFCVGINIGPATRN
jgi:hypothetical protein